jgi:formylglycine-generating enzyme required for sulfatase activity
MKLTFTLFALLALFTLRSTAADVLLQPTNSPANAKTNIIITGPPKVLADAFTNSADMIVIKIGAMGVGRYDVTQKEYQKIVGLNPSAFPGATHPVDSVSWNDAMEFCTKMTESDIKEKKIPDGYYYTLPTEDEWESLVGDASLDDAVTSLNGDRDGTAPVGSTKPNSLGLFDMRGNVMQFTLGDDSKPYRVLRGGSWKDSIEINLRIEFRHYTPPDNRENTFGFRCVLKKH